MKEQIKKGKVSRWEDRQKKAKEKELTKQREQEALDNDELNTLNRLIDEQRKSS